MVIVVAVFFAGMGVFALAAPNALVRPFGIALRGGEARTEVRAVYGGFGLAMAGVLIVAATDPAEHAGMVVAVAVALLGMAAGRVIGRFFDRPKAFYPAWFYFWVEIVAGGVLLVAARG
jgi:hypothetical protein